MSSQIGGLGIRTLLKYLLSWAQMDSNKLSSCECSPWEWVTGGLRTPQKKTISQGRERMPERDKEGTELLSFGPKETLLCLQEKE